MSRLDCVVVGAGAAGIAATRRLVQSGQSVLLLEARRRVGGRSWTVESGRGFPLDLGCEWLHSADRNKLAKMAPEAGFTLVERPPDWGNLADHPITDEERRAWREARVALTERIAAAAGELPDRPASTLLDPGGRWNALLNASSSFANGVELDLLSVHDNARYEDTGVNWRVLEGYGALIARLAEGLPVRLGCAVRAIELARGAVRLDTEAGALEASRVIVTLPTNLIAAQAVRFTPLLAEKVEAAAGLPLGVADKVCLAIEDGGADLPSGHHVLGSTTRTETGSYQLRPFGRPVIAGFLGGRNARALEGAGPEAMIAFAVDELAALFGEGMRRRVTPLATTAWAADPLARGSYSYALPGAAELRAVLAEPVEDRLFFAGEAVSPRFFSTAHGAWQSGVAAAERVIASAARGEEVA